MNIDVSKSDAHPMQPGWQKRLNAVIWRLLPFVVVFGAWEIVGRIPVSLALPPFSAVVRAFWHLLITGVFTHAYEQTLPALAIGLLIVSVMGVAVGVAMGLSRGAEWLFYPLMVVMQAAPMAAVIPLIVFIYGIGLTSQVIAVVIMSAPMVVLNCYTGIRHTSTSLLEMCASFTGTRWQQVTKIVLPHASGMIFAGLRLGISGAFIGVVLAELLITPIGIGDTISYYRSMALYPEMFAAILSIILLATLVLTAVQMVERKIFSAIGQGARK